MKPLPIPTLTGKEAERFIQQDKKPLTETQKTRLQKAREVYLSSQK
jgi:hypothetical protein